MEITEEKNIRRYCSGKIRVYRIPVECYSNHITNVYLVLDQVSFLIDTAIASKRANKMLTTGFRTIQKEFHEDITLNDIKNIVITHGHVDHFGMLGNEEFKGKNIYVHKDDSEYIKNYSPTIAYNLIHIDQLLKKAGTPDPLREGLIAVWRNDFELLKPQAINQPLITVHDGEQIIAGYRVYHTPGHSRGAICLEVGDFLFVGDHLLSHITPHQSPACSQRGNGLAVYFNSLTKISQLCQKKENLYALPGHGEDVFPVNKRLTEIHSFHLSRLRDIEIICQKAKTIYEITLEYFNSFQPNVFAQPEIPDFNKLLAILEISSHIEFLQQKGRIIRVDSGTPPPKYQSKVQ